MWIGRIENVVKNADGLTLTLTYSLTDDTPGGTVVTVVEPLVPSKESVVQIVQDAEDYRNRVDAQRAAITALDPATIIGALFAVRNVVYPPPPPLTPAQARARVLREDWKRVYLHYLMARAFEEAGVTVTPTAAADAALLVTKFLPGYESIFDEVRR